MFSLRVLSIHYLKEKFLELLAQKSGIPKFISCAKDILNCFDFSYTNGFTEGCNNKIKVLKRNAYGYRNFKRFRNRILHMFSHQKQKSSAVA